MVEARHLGVLRAGDVGGGSPAGHRERDFRGGLAKLAGVLPDRDGLRAERDAVERSEIAVLAGNRNALEALRRQRGDDAACGAVIRGDHGIDVVVVGREDLLHVPLGVRRQPAVGIGFADDGDCARIECLLQDFLLAAAEEIRVRIRGRALDHHVVALGGLGEHRTGFHPADLDVVEGEVEGARIRNQAVVAHDRHALVRSRLDGGADGIAVLGKDDERIRAARNQALHIGKLLGRRALRIGGNVIRAGGLEGRDNGRLVGLPALFLEIGPAHADGNVLSECRARQPGSQNGRGQRLERCHAVISLVNLAFCPPVPIMISVRGSPA